MKKIHLKSCLEAQKVARCVEPGLKSAQGDLFSVPILLLVSSAFQEFVCQTFLRFDPGTSWKP